MSYAEAFSSLHVDCKDMKQKKHLLDKFESDNPLAHSFSLTDGLGKGLKIWFVLEDCDVSSDFDDDILKLDKWLKENFNLTLNGYWEYEIDGTHWRCEIHNGEIHDAAIDWLTEYTVEQINELRKYAESHYKQKENTHG